MKKIALIIPAMILTGCTNGSFFGKITVDGSGNFIDKEFKDLVGETLTIKDIDLYEDKIVELEVHYSTDEKKITMNVDEEINEHITVEAKSKEIKFFGKQAEEYKTDHIKIDVYGYTFSTLNLSITKATIDSRCLTTTKFELNAAALSEVKITGTYTLADEAKVALNVSGVSQVSIANMTADEGEYNVSGKSTLYIGTDNTKKVEANVSGVSSLTHGSSSAAEINKIDVNLSGTSQYYAFYRYAKLVNANISGASSCKTRVLESLIVSASGASICYYKTENPDLTIRSNLSGGSKLQQD